MPRIESIAGETITDRMNNRSFPNPPREGSQHKLLDIERLYDRVDYRPHPGQRRFHASQSRFKVMCCGRRWGKSTSGPHDKLPNFLLKEPKIGWIVAPTYDLGEKEFRVFWSVIVDKLGLPLDRSKTFYSLRTKDFRITTAWGSSIEVRSAEHPESLVGEGLDFVIMAEAAKLKLSHWEKYIRPTLADKRGSAVFVSTPEGFNWFYDLYQRGQSGTREAKDWWSYRSPTWENTIIFPGGRNDPEMLEVEANSAEEVFEQEYGANFTSFAGRIYSEFDEGYHVVHNYKFNPEWTNYMAFDFGFRNPFVCLNIQVDPSDNVYVWDEYYERNITTPDHARRLKSIVQWRVDGGYYDPSGADEGATLMKMFHDTQEYHNRWLDSVTLNPAPNEWKTGVERVKTFLKLVPTHDNYGDPTSKLAPKLYVSEDCVQTIREFNTYRVKEQTEKMTEKIDPKDEPRKKDDHAMDALRYFIAGHFGLEQHWAISM
jgi:Terminase RNaseH-like domain/Terminase large subunit, T4likevirus-type, N-terminal